MASKLILGDFATELVPAKSVPFAVVLMGVPQTQPPTGSASSTRPTVPLLLSLHGGGGNRDSVVRAFQAGEYDRRLEEDGAPPMVVATISAQNSFYSDFHDGSERWESFLFSEFVPFIERTHGCGGRRGLRYLAGTSMGGHGSLKLAFKHPNHFAAAAVLEPALDAALVPSDLNERNFLVAFQYDPGQKDMIDATRMLGGAAPASYDAGAYRRWNPASIAADNAAAIRASGVKLFFECGDDDYLNLHDGAEFLHRVLWDHGIQHEYRLYHGADHLGPTLEPRGHARNRWLFQAMREELGLGPAGGKAHELASKKSDWKG